MAASQNPKRAGAARRLVRAGLGLGSGLLLAGAITMVGDSVIDVSRRNRIEANTVAYSRASSDCRSCHQEIFETWAASEHAHAHRPVGRELDREAVAASPGSKVFGIQYTVGWKDGRPHFEEQPDGKPAQAYTADFVLGYRPLRQYIVPVGEGRYQAAELAFDPAKQEWFNVFGSEQRQPGEWGHWRGRGMNWNSMCAHCHLTDFSKNYDPATDTYRSTWLEHGVGCVQCHDGLTADHASPGYRTSPARWQEVTDKNRNGETCAPCHARNELLTGEPRAGLAYHDHYRIALPTDPRVFYPDGQVLDEDFNWTSLLTSRMGGKAGVTCLDCHDPHSGRTRLPAQTNALCLQCHTPGDPRGAPPIDPVAHSHHAPDSPGNQCITCHMPTTVYMQRAPRHDHGFLKPDPLLTKELQIPNACDRCHADKGLDWQIEWNERWYGAKLENRQRERARAVAAAQRGETDGAARVRRLLADEDIPAWRATLLLLLRGWAEDPAVIAAARLALHDEHPLVRSAAVQVLAAAPAERPGLRPLLQDPVRLVRLDAAWALSAELAPDSPARRELDAYLAFGADQPAGQLRLAHDLANRGRIAEAESAARRAAEWDPHSPPVFETLGLLLDRQGRPAESAAALWRSAELEPQSGSRAFEAGLAFAAAGQADSALMALRESVRRQPDLHRAWYNLGLLLTHTGAPHEAIESLQRAETLAPEVSDYPYARATVLWQLGQRAAARAAAHRVLEFDPSHEGARRLLDAR